MSERDPRPAPTFDIPDLDLEPAVAQRSSAPSASRTLAADPPPAPTPAREIDLGSSDDEDFELIQAGPSVELSGAGAHAARTAALESGPWPSGRTRPSDQLPVDPLEVSVVADYGAVPRNALGAPLYAYRVFARRRDLQKSIAEQHQALVAVELERDSALMQLGLDLRPALESSTAFRRLLEPVIEVERLASDRGAALSTADAGYRQEMAQFDGELLRLREAEARAQQLAAEKRGVADSTESELARAEAKSKRLQIETRGVMDLARQAVGPAGGDIPPAQAAQLAELQAKVTALEPELSRAKAAYAGAYQALEQADAELRRLQVELRRLDRQKSTAGDALQQQLSVRVAGVSDAEKQRRDAWAEVARAVLVSRGAVPVPEQVLEGLRAHDRRIEAHALRLETHLRALDSQDPLRVRQGVLLALSALGLVVLAIALKAVL
jgi:hypothetical protein